MAVWMAAGGAWGVILMETSDPTANTTAPTGEYADSGWQYQGRWGNFLGTVISPNCFITAGHVGGAVGRDFRFEGTDYTAIASFDDPASDLRIWQVCGEFPRHALLYLAGDEVGRDLVVIGRGTQRGAEVTDSDLTGTHLRGWRWGSADGVVRWGANVVAEVIDGDGLDGELGGDGTVGELLRATFDLRVSTNEAHLSTGDSGGGLFIEHDGEWKLAGINYAVDGRYNTSASGAGFNASIFDEGGLYTGGDGDWMFNPDLPVDQAGGFYATRISSHIEWIQGVLATAAMDIGPWLQSAGGVNGTYAGETGASVDTQARTVTIPLPSGTRFYRLRGCAAVRITAIETSGGDLVFRYELF
jgi:hypothetical protein